MKYYILIFLVTSVVAAYRVINVNPEFNDASKPRDQIDSKASDVVRIPLERFRDEKVYDDDGVTPGSSSPSIFGPSISSFFKFVQDSMRMMLQRSTSPFRQHLPFFFPSNPKSEGDSVVANGSLHQMIPEMLMPHLSIPSIHKLPPNYSNKSSQIHNSKDSNLMVNETINKKSGPGFSHFFVIKTFQLVPTSSPDVKVAEEEAPIIVDEIVDEPKPDTRLNEVEFKGDVDPLEEDQLGDTPEGGESLIKEREIRRLRREIGNRIVGSSPKSGKKSIEFLPSDINRFPQSFLNNANIRKQDLKNSDGESISKSYVYKNIGGKTTMYIINHKPKSGSYQSEPVGTNVGGIRPPDLSRDTKVNPSGDDDQQQSLVLVDPDAEVFDLNLVAKEIESRPKNK